jgi:hypothetical protein
VKCKAERDTVLEATWIFLAAIVFDFVIALRIRLLGIPLERNQGEYAHAGQLLLQGVLPYKLPYNIKFPEAYAACALFMALFRQNNRWHSSRLAFNQRGDHSANSHLPAQILAHSNYSWRVFDTSVRQLQFSAILIGSLPLW